MGEVTNNHKFIVIDNLTYAGKMAEMHMSAFSNVLSGQLGTAFLQYLYRTLIERGVVIGCFVNGHLMGFVSGIFDDRNFYDRKHYLYGLRGVVTKLFSFRTILNVLRHIKKSISATEGRVRTELFSIVVLEEYKRKGIGKELVKEFEDYLGSKGIEEYKVFTDMEFSDGSKLYGRMGFSINRELRLLGLTLREYLKRI